MQYLQYTERLAWISVKSLFIYRNFLSTLAKRDLVLWCQCALPAFLILLYLCSWWMSYFSEALLFSTMLLMKVRNLFLHTFIDSQAFERRKSPEFWFLVVFQTSRQEALTYRTKEIRLRWWCKWWFRRGFKWNANKYDHKSYLLSYFLMSWQSSVCVCYPKPLRNLFVMRTVKL